MKSAIAALCVIAVSAVSLFAADQTNKSGSGLFVSYLDGTLTLKSKSGQSVYEKVGENYKTYQNNEDGPGSKLVPTVRALKGEQIQGNITPLSRVMPGTLVRVDVDAKEIFVGLDYRVIGTFESFQDGKLNLVAVDVPQGFIKIPTGNVTLEIDRSIPVLESIKGGDLKFAGLAGDVMKSVKKGATVTVRSEYDPDNIEVLEIGEPKRRMERYVGQSRGTVRGSFVSFKDGILRIRGKGITGLAAGEYERLVTWRIADTVPILESIDGGEYKPVTAETLQNLKEGTVVTIRKAEDVIMSIQIGLAK